MDFFFPSFLLFASLVLTRVFRILFRISAPNKPQAIISEETAQEMEGDHDESKEEPRLRRPKSKSESIHGSLSAADGNNSSKNNKIESSCCSVV